MTVLLHGTIRGRTIELAEDPGLLEGQQVEITMRAMKTESTELPGTGLLRTEGALADDPYWDEIMAEIQAERKNDVRPLPDFE